MKRIQKLTASCLIIFFMLSMLPIAVSGASFTSASAIQWLKSKKGESIDVDGAYGAQCVDLIMAYYEYLVGYHVRGNACDYSTNELPTGWTRVQGGEPRTGDIIIYAGGWGNGHVAIYESDTSTWHQNYNGSSVKNVQNRKYTDIHAYDDSSYWGYIHPNFSDIPAIYTITYHVNGGYDAPEKQTKMYGQTVKLSEGQPSRIGYLFSGWALSPSALEAEYAKGQAFDINESVTLYAVWTPCQNHTAGEWELSKRATTVSAGTVLKKCTLCHTVLESKSTDKMSYKTEASAQFSDVSKNKWYYNAVNFAYNSELFLGVDDEKFAPNDNMTRGMFVTVLGRLGGADVKKGASVFEDVEANRYYSGYVRWANELGIVNGTSPTTFAPDDDVTREQICKMMVAYCSATDIEIKALKDPVTFTDADDISGWAKKYVKTCQTGGLVNGSYGEFNPKGNATRAEVATILMNFANHYLK